MLVLTAISCNRMETRGRKSIGRSLIEVSRKHLYHLNRLEALADSNNYMMGFIIIMCHAGSLGGHGSAQCSCPDHDTCPSHPVGKYQLIYFAIRGRGESVRLLFKDNGIDFEEIACQEDKWYSEWKPQMQFGQLPCLRDGSLQVVQSNAILRHLARKHGLYGSNLEEAAQIDMINDGVEDLRLKYVALIYKNYENGKDEYIADLPNQLQPFEKLLSKSGADKSGCCVGKKKSFADYSLTDVLDIHQVLAPKCLDSFPVLSAYYKLSVSSPGIAEYRKTEAFKQRPINYNGKQ